MRKKSKVDLFVTEQVSSDNNDGNESRKIQSKFVNLLHAWLSCCVYIGRIQQLTVTAPSPPSIKGTV